MPRIKNIELFGKKIPLTVIVAAIVLAAIGTGIMASQFNKGPQTFYATGTVFIVQSPNRAEINDNITVNPVNSTPGSESFQEVFTIYHRNNKLVLVEVKLTNTDMIRKFFDDFVVLIRKQNDDALLATLTPNNSIGTFIDDDPDALNGVKFKADIFYTARDNVTAGRIPVIITAEVTSQ